MDAFGSNAIPTGGILGRVDAVYGSIECQKCGTLHGHFQVFVQCLHQFTPIGNIAQVDEASMRSLLQKYSTYTAHVTRMVYTDPVEWERQRDAVEAEWPEYRNSTLALSRPEYQRDDDMSSTCWRHHFLDDDVEQLQQHKQHHVHLPTGPHGERQPLAHCRTVETSVIPRSASQGSLEPNGPQRCHS
eukprot:5684601-Amphidinium_carterae.2